jgi:hypothetical protein
VDTASIGAKLVEPAVSPTCDNKTPCAGVTGKTLFVNMPALVGICILFSDYLILL